MYDCMKIPELVLESDRWETLQIVRKIVPKYDKLYGRLSWLENWGVSKWLATVLCKMIKKSAKWFLKSVQND